MQSSQRIDPASSPVELGTHNMAHIAQFYIPAAASLQERRPRTLKHGETFALFDHNGDALGAPGSPEGVFFRDTRHLSYLYLTIDGARPLLLSSTVRDDNATLTCDLTNPDLVDANGEIYLEHDLIHLRRSRFIWNGACYERLMVKNYDEQARDITIGVAFDADFSDLFEVRGSRRPMRGERHPPHCQGNSVALAYVGLDDIRRETTLRFEPVPETLTGTQAIFRLHVPAHACRVLRLQITCGSDDAAERIPFLRSLRQARRDLHRSASRAVQVTTSNEIFNELMGRSVSDLYMLLTETAQGPYPYAGIPWFSTPFGRDALITALETLWLDPAIARGVLGYLSVNQATAMDAATDAEPGKILHEIRHGEMANLGEVPFGRYYGSIDSTPLFVMLAGAYLRRTGDIDTLRAIWPAIGMAIEWLRQYGDRDGDGFIEYFRQTEHGLVNQGWKDSRDSVFHANGVLADGPIALVEVQAYAYGAWQAASEIAAALRDAPAATSYRATADHVRAAFDRTFFDDELGTYVIALDGAKTPCRVQSSNSGHALFTGIAEPVRAAAVARTLMHSAMYCGWGVRTVSSTTARFNPMSYHNGSVWPHDNALIGAGLARYGFKDEARRIFEGLFAASTYIDLRRLPELFCGIARQRTQGPTFYPVACSPQAWAAAAPLLLLQACLGLDFDPTTPGITFNQPVLPDFLDEVVLRNLSVQGASLDVAVRRSGARVVVDVLERRGAISVVTRH